MKVVAAALSVAMVAARAPILRGHNVHDRDVVPNSYIGVFEPSADASTLSSSVALLKAQGADVVYEYNIADSFIGFSATLDEAQLDFASNLPGLAYLEVDSLAYALQSNPTCSTTQSGATWGIARVDGVMGSTSTFTHSSTGGAGILVYIFDTGIQCDAHSGGEFANDCGHGFCASGLANCNGDGNGHGTHVAGTASSVSYGVAKGADLTNAKVLGDNGSGSFAGIVAGVEWAANHHNGRGVGNMSLGGGGNTALDSAINSAHNDADFFSVVAAGNGGGANGSCNGSPSRALRAFSIGSTTSANARSSFSDQGSCMNLFAPGSSITSTSRTGGTATMSGTSMASPHVAGGATVMRGNSASNSAESIWTAMIANGISNAISGVNAQTPNIFLDTC